MADQSPAMVLVQAQLADKKTRVWIAAEIGFSDSHVRRYLLGHYAGTKSLINIEKAIVKRFDRRICPHDGLEKQPVQCQRVAFRARPYGFPDAETLWLACQTCPHKPQQPGAQS